MRRVSNNQQGHLNNEIEMIITSISGDFDHYDKDVPVIQQDSDVKSIPIEYGDYIVITNHLYKIEMLDGTEQSVYRVVVYKDVFSDIRYTLYLLPDECRRLCNIRQIPLVD